MMYVDLRLWLPDDLLLVGDKTSMAASVKRRVPVLDTELLDFVEALPSLYKVRYGRRKAIEKAALAPLLPKATVHRKERGFATPMRRWLRDEIQPLARKLLLSPDSCCGAWFNPSTIERLLKTHVQERSDYTPQLLPS
jgi:asparagine synthase (glutamine-hydrolysing)